MTSRFLAFITLAFLLVGCATSNAWFPAKVTRISKEYANINTDITEQQLKDKGITQGSQFNVKFGEHKLEAFLGKTYTDVERGEWVALFEEDGKLQIAISFGHAAEAISCAAGDTLYIERK